MSFQQPAEVPPLHEQVSDLSALAIKLDQQSGKLQVIIQFDGLAHAYFTPEAWNTFQRYVQHDSHLFFNTVRRVSSTPRDPTLQSSEDDVKIAYPQYVSQMQEHVEKRRYLQELSILVIGLLAGGGISYMPFFPRAGGSLIGASLLIALTLYFLRRLL